MQQLYGYGRDSERQLATNRDSERYVATPWVRRDSEIHTGSLRETVSNHIATKVAVFRSFYSLTVLTNTRLLTEYILPRLKKQRVSVIIMPNHSQPLLFLYQDIALTTASKQLLYPE